MFLDSNGNIVQKDLDGGDTAQRTGFVESILQFRDMLGIPNGEFYDNTPWRFNQQWPTLFTKDKKLIRNPIKWNDPKDTSRDQTTPMIIAFGLHGQTEQIEAIRPKGFLIKWYQNKDVASPADISIVDRAFGHNEHFPGDYWAHFGIRIRCATKNLDDVGDDLNTFLCAVFSYMVHPTMIAYCNLRYYLLNRPKSYGTIAFEERDPVMAALMWYCRPITGGNPDIAELCRPLVERLRQKLSCTLP